jgi:hypothetical protein
VSARLRFHQPGTMLINAALRPLSPLLRWRFAGIARVKTLRFP